MGIKDYCYVECEDTTFNSIIPTFKKEKQKEIERLYGYKFKKVTNLVKFIPETTETTDKICKILELCQEYGDNYESDGIFYVEIEGDWKHSHKRIDELVEHICNKSVEILEEINVEEMDSDFYMSTHRYKILK